MRSSKSEPLLSRRERQALDAVLRLREAAVADVLAQVPDAASYDSLRSTLNILVRKGHLTRRRDGHRHIYIPLVTRRAAGRAAATRLLRTFFAGEPTEAILTLLDLSERDLDDAELDEIRAWIDRASENS